MLSFIGNGHDISSDCLFNQAVFICFDDVADSHGFTFCSGFPFKANLAGLGGDKFDGFDWSRSLEFRVSAYLHLCRSRFIIETIF